MAQQALIPGLGFVDETVTTQALVPGAGFVNETVSGGGGGGFVVAWAASINTIISTGARTA
jgi:hypothetical protein